MHKKTVDPEMAFFDRWEDIGFKEFLFLGFQNLGFQGLAYPGFVYLFFSSCDESVIYY